ncbi:uncharacterized protein N7458_005966 [Penicillium daleae]|uniref:Uncharacterized protein n=1 Tax=Penicillium daleae TaxID=63821 RepID=A0AAD6G1A5_9EURO|nr:uncharacterized protein N7458_005966 [Penicillium daleae]KAJ5449517.1 hypothetical protein N7458_005966 [Penicillium daleae]
MNSNCELIHRERVMGLQFSRSGNQLATYGPTMTTLWDVSTKRPSETFSNTPNTTVLALAFAKDDCAIFMFSDDYVLRKVILDGSAQNCETIDLGAHRETASHWVNPSCATFDHQTNFLAVGFRGDPIEVWDIQSFDCVERLGGLSYPQSDVLQLCWCPQPDRLIVRQGNGCLRILDLLRHAPIATCIDTVSVMSYNATSEFLVTGDMAGTVTVRRIHDLALLYHARGSESSILALSVAPGGGKVYGIQSSKCIVWEPSLLATMASHQRGQVPFSSGYLSQGPQLTQDDSFVTALATCERSSAYCAGYANGQIRVIFRDGTGSFLDLPTRVRIERLLWSPDEQYLAIVDLGARVFIMSMDHERYRSNQLTPIRLQSCVEQILFQRTSQALLVVTKDDMLTWDLGTGNMKASHHSLGSHSRWINHPTKDGLILGMGPDNVLIYQWHNHLTVSSISLDNSMSYLTFGLGLLDYVKTEPSSMTLHPTSATCQVKRVLSSPDASMLLLVTTRQTKESISGSQFLQIPMRELNDKIALSHGVVCPFPLIESLSDIIAMPLGFLSQESSEGAMVQVPGNRLIFLNKENWICSTWIDSSNEEHPVQRHIFLPDDWLAAGDMSLIQFRSDRIYIPRSEHIVIIRNALDVSY